ncbi:tail fiber domain-containing protein [Pontibacter sp. G13]|uniref:tail fiber domain-containing protein n=1 Tax=Pontibacter sp. G13 TaxID=3074898 RepID=UPI00288C304B|nr:tail fiber domain-containing protein [Pontibacter sp. G13]WNJ17001.1 tail fiber domain-containing protein [Pontibacter sp. G13]
MKKLVLLFTLLVSSCYGFAQLSGIPYQAVIRDAQGAILSNQPISVRFSILDSNVPVFQETHVLQTNDFGLVNTTIGQGVVVFGDYAQIDWRAIQSQIQVELDLGTGYVLMGSQPIGEVPYSIRAQKSDIADQMTLDLLTDVQAANPVANQVLQWNGAAWEPASLSSGTAYQAGAGIQINGPVIENTGDTDPTDDLTNTSNAGGDVSGNFSGLSVNKIRGRTVSNAAPTNGEVLKWNGSQWVPDADENNAYTAGSGIQINNGTITNLGDTDPSDDLTNSSNAGGDVSGNFSGLSVNKIRGRTVSNAAPTNGEVLKWNGSQWVPDADENNAYTAGSGIQINNGTITNLGDTDPSDDLTNSSNAGGDVSGNFSGLSVNKIRGRTVSNAAPTNGEVLKWNGSQWVPDADENNAYTAGSGIQINNGTITNLGDTDPTDDLTNSSNAGGDVSGNFSGLSVNKIRGRTVSNAAPTNGEVLKWNGSQWVPDADENNAYTAGSGIQINNGTITNLGDTDPTDDLTNTSNAGGDVSGNFSGLSVNKIRGRTVSNAAPTNGEVLKWNGSQWVPDADADSDLWTETGDDIYFSSGQVAIGSQTPVADFHVGAGKSVLFGADTTGAGYRFQWMADRGAFRAGYLGNSSGTYWDPDSVGYYSTALGSLNRAMGQFSVAMGYNSKASGLAAFAMGQQAHADGFISFAFGNYSKALGSQSIAFIGGDALGSRSISIGGGSQATEFYSIALGDNAESLEDWAISIGHSTVASGKYSLAMGYFSDAKGAFTSSFGQYTEAEAYNDFAIGRYNVAGGDSGTWVSSDPVFEVGIGSSAVARKNAMTILKDGKTGIGLAAPNALLHLKGSINLPQLRIANNSYSNYWDMRMTSSTALRMYYNGTQVGYWGSSSGTYYATSDRRLKTDIQPIESVLDRVLQLEPVTYRFTRNAGIETQPTWGFIAQEVEQQFPTLVAAPDEESDYYAIDYAQFSVLAIKAIQEQQELIDQQQAQIDQLIQLVQQLQTSARDEN